MSARYRGAFADCRYCYGRGCLCCDGERKKYEATMATPLFVARRDNPDDMRRLKQVFGAEALQRAFGPGGGGMKEVEVNAIMASIAQLLDDNAKGIEHPDYSPLRDGTETEECEP